MFVGEMGCWFVVGLLKFYICWMNKISFVEWGYEVVNIMLDVVDWDDVDDDEDGYGKLVMMVLCGRKIIMLVLLVICDICGMIFMNVGLLLVVVFIYQMICGVFVFFVGFFSVLFLKRRFYFFQWLFFVGVVFGVVVVGFFGVLWLDKKVSESIGVEVEVERLSVFFVLIGFFFIVGVQIFIVIQFVLEEWILECYFIELFKVVGWEGIFGFVFIVLGMVILYFVIGWIDVGRFGLFDMIEGWCQMMMQKVLSILSILIMISIG